MTLSIDFAIGDILNLSRTLKKLPRATSISTLPDYIDGLFNEYACCGPYYYLAIECPIYSEANEYSRYLLCVFYANIEGDIIFRSIIVRMSTTDFYAKATEMYLDAINSPSDVSRAYIYSKEELSSLCRLTGSPESMFSYLSENIDNRTNVITELVRKRLFIISNEYVDLLLPRVLSDAVISMKAAEDLLLSHLRSYIYDNITVFDNSPIDKQALASLLVRIIDGRSISGLSEYALMAFGGSLLFNDGENGLGEIRTKYNLFEGDVYLIPYGVSFNYEGRGKYTMSGLSASSTAEFDELYRVGKVL